MLSEPRWLELAVVVEINATLVAETGEPFTLRDEGLLDSALHAPRFLFHYDEEADVVVLATALMLAISRNHAFAQGNKRTGFAAALLFLELNGYAVEMPDQEWVAEAFIREIEGRDHAVVMETVLRTCIKPAG